MKVMFISDIHGSYYWANKAIEKYHEEKAVQTRYFRGYFISWAT